MEHVMVWTGGARSIIYSKHKQTRPQNEVIRFAIQPMFAIDVIYFLESITFSEP